MELFEKCIAEFEFITDVMYDLNIPIHASVVQDMAAFRTSQDGNTGLTNIGLNGVSETYRNGYDANIMRILMKLKKRVRVM